MGKLALVKEKIIRRRGHGCECCRRELGIHAAHIFFGTDNRKRKGYDKFYTVEENIALICPTCHGHADGKSSAENFGKSKSQEWLATFMAIQAQRYGSERMSNWLGAFPAKLRTDRWDSVKRLLERN